MGASVSLQGRFCHDMDPDSSILVSSIRYIEIEHSDGLLSIFSEMYRVSYALRYHTRSTTEQDD